MNRSAAAISAIPRRRRRALVARLHEMPPTVGVGQTPQRTRRLARQIERTANNARVCRQRSADLGAPTSTAPAESTAAGCERVDPRAARLAPTAERGRSASRRATAGRSGERERRVRLPSTGRRRRRVSRGPWEISESSGSRSHCCAWRGRVIPLGVASKFARDVPARLRARGDLILPQDCNHPVHATRAPPPTRPRARRARISVNRHEIARLISSVTSPHHRQACRSGSDLGTIDEVRDDRTPSRARRGRRCTASCRPRTGQGWLTIALGVTVRAPTCAPIQNRANALRHIGADGGDRPALCSAGSRAVPRRCSIACVSRRASGTGRQSGMRSDVHVDRKDQALVGPSALVTSTCWRPHLGGRRARTGAPRRCGEAVMYASATQPAVRVDRKLAASSMRPPRRWTLTARQKPRSSSESSTSGPKCLELGDVDPRGQTAAKRKSPMRAVPSMP